MNLEMNTKLTFRGILSRISVEISTSLSATLLCVTRQDSATEAARPGGLVAVFLNSLSQLLRALTFTGGSTLSAVTLHVHFCPVCTR